MNKKTPIKNKINNKYCKKKEIETKLTKILNPQKIIKKPFKTTRKK